MTPEAQITAVVMGKGGVGKSTSATTIAAALAAQDRQVLLTDFDRQGSCSTLLGIDAAPDVARHIIFGERLQNCIYPDPTRPGLHLWRSNSTTLTADGHARDNRWNAHQLVEEIEMLPTTYDHIIIDTPPVGYLQEVGIQIAHHLIMPVTLDLLGVQQLVKTITAAQQLGQHNITILPIFHDNTRETRYNLSILEERYPDLLAAPIPRRAAVREAQAEGRTIVEFEAANDAANAYMQLVNRITADDSELLFSMEE